MRNEIKFRSCPLCGSNNVLLLFPSTSTIPRFAEQIKVTEKYFGLHGDIVRCTKCGFIYVGKELYVKKIIRLYEMMSDDVYLQEEKERSLSFIGVIRTLENLRQGAKGKILDVGCCTGGLLVEAQKRGWEGYGVDPSIWAFRIAKRLHGLDVYNGSLESFNLPSQRFNAITLLDVLEHVEDPKLLMHKIHAL